MWGRGKAGGTVPLSSKSIVEIKELRPLCSVSFTLLFIRYTALILHREFVDVDVAMLPDDNGDRQGECELPYPTRSRLTPVAR